MLRSIHNANSRCIRHAERPFAQAPAADYANRTVPAVLPHLDVAPRNASYCKAPLRIRVRNGRRLVATVLAGSDSGGKSADA